MIKFAKFKKDNNAIKNTEINEPRESLITKEDTKEKKETDIDKRRNKKKFIIILIVVILVFLLTIGGIVTYYYIKESSKISKISRSQEETLKNFSEEIKYGQEFSYDNLVDNLIDTYKLHENTNITILINDEILSNKDTFKF